MGFFSPSPATSTTNQSSISTFQPTAYAQQAIREKLIDHKNYIARYGEDMPELRDWKWPGGATAGRATDTAADNV